MKRKISFILSLIMIFNFVGVIGLQVTLAANLNEQKTLYEESMQELYDLGYRENMEINSKETYEFLLNLGFTKKEILELYNDYWQEQSLENSFVKDNSERLNNELFPTSQPKEGDFKYRSFDFHYQKLSNFLGLVNVYSIAQLIAHASKKQIVNALINVYGVCVISVLSLYILYLQNAHPGKVGVRGRVCYKYTRDNNHTLDWVAYPAKSTRVYY